MTFLRFTFELEFSTGRWLLFCLPDPGHFGKICGCVSSSINRLKLCC